ncbi:MAG: enoyl-CoA hydratase/isomerase family protein [Nitrospirae bacterium]|nr:enoyl-CoA hydratase/isomerase family protein [Nitrospirota bacterium]
MAGIERRRTGDVVEVVLNRPEVKNAFNAELITDLARAFTEIAKDETVRVVVLRSEGNVFCAGADLNWMKECAGYSFEQNREDARRVAQMFRIINECPHPVIGRVQGAAYGGGAGVVAVCDIVVASTEATFGFTEVKVGLIPAVVSPFVIRKIGEGNARRFFLTGEILPADAALFIGLVHHVTDAANLDGEIRRLTELLLKNSPQAVRDIKKLVRAESGLGLDQALPLCADAIAKIRVSPEGQEGLRAFLEKRAPLWKRAASS